MTSHERIRVVHQNISKWDKNKDGRLTGAEREAFLADKRKERIAADANAQAAKPKPPKRVQRIPPPMRPEDAHRPAAKGVPKNIEDAQRAGH
jgi:hypothetical protein